MDNKKYGGLTITLTGRPIGQRFEIMAEGKSIALSGTSFFYLFQLVYFAVSKPGFWVPKEDIEDTGHQAKYIYRMRRELEANGINTDDLVDNNRKGCYRINTTSADCSIMKDYLRNHPDFRIRERVRLLGGDCGVRIVNV